MSNRLDKFRRLSNVFVKEEELYKLSLKTGDHLTYGVRKSVIFSSI